MIEGNSDYNVCGSAINAIRSVMLLLKFGICPKISAIAPRMYGDWQVVRPLGEGGQGYTYIVINNSVGSEEFALKRLKNTKRLERFRTEVDTINSIGHPNVIKIIDVDLESKEPYYVTKLYSGGDLTNHLLNWKNDNILALKIFRRICDGVRAAHVAGIVHRDLEPEDILFTPDDGHPVVADFGIAYVEDGERQTLTLEAVGPRFYIAPELEDGRADFITVRSDLYSLGKILYWMLSGGHCRGQNGFLLSWARVFQGMQPANIATKRSKAPSLKCLIAS